MLRRGLIALSLMLPAVGCTSEEFRNWAGPLKKENGRPVLVPEKLPPASAATDTRVDSLGRDILAANKDIGIQPVFSTVGLTELSIFHVGAQQLVITEGLVNKCKSDAELSAILCSELGKMASESQASGMSINDSNPPYAPQVGGDVAGAGNNSDPSMTQQAERALWQQRNPKPANGGFVSAPNPGELSRTYLSRAGYNPDELIRVAPLLRQAEANSKIEQQLMNSRNSTR